MFAPSWGPSPRVRGSPPCAQPPGTPIGSIPACAGEPARTKPRTVMIWVHPRVCGGARTDVPLDVAQVGPSPRVRGSRLTVDLYHTYTGSIPACAGEPRTYTPTPIVHGVHPRVCGGALLGSSSDLLGSGPSPRVRGSLDVVERHHLPRGSIPACAGEPWASHSRSCLLWVHPRVCGGAVWSRLHSPLHVGPSPRVRGSQADRLPRSLLLGSIPACAGEPRAGAGLQTIGGVHPRVCGGAFKLGSTARRVEISNRSRSRRSMSLVCVILAWASWLRWLCVVGSHRSVRKTRRPQASQAPADPPLIASTDPTVSPRWAGSSRLRHRGAGHRNTGTGRHAGVEPAPAPADLTGGRHRS